MIRSIWSGGQTGVDRAALDVARELGIPIGGWCAKGGYAEDGADLLHGYPELRETPSADPSQRSRWNVRDSDATLLLLREGTLSAGTEYTLQCVEALAKPMQVVVLGAEVAAELSGLLAGFDGTLNVAGPRESQAPGIYAEARALLGTILRET